jgi:hypothetical protein
MPLSGALGLPFRITLAKDGRSGNDPFSPMPNDRRNIVQPYSPVHLYMNVQAARINHTPQPTYLVKRGPYEGLPPNPGFTDIIST